MSPAFPTSLYLLNRVVRLLVFYSLVGVEVLIFQLVSRHAQDTTDVLSADLPKEVDDEKH